MSVEKIKGAYDSVYSLGNLCLGALQMKKFNLRPFAGVLDWVGSHSLPDVSRLLQNRFSGFMEQPKLSVVGQASVVDLLVLDNEYKIYFNHDFKTDKNTVYELTDYPAVKAKYDRRIQRFLEKMATSRRILFIRTEGTYEEIRELESILSGLVANDFRLLVVNHANVGGMVELNWPLEKVYAVQMPDVEKWDGNDHYWAQIFDGIHLM